MISADAGYAFDYEWFAAVLRVSLSALRHGRVPGIELECAGARAVAVLGEEVHRRRQRRATWIRRWSGSRCGSRPHLKPANRFVVPATAGRCRCTATGAHGECRRRPLPRWQPPSALHPTIEVHAPLVVRHRRTVERALAGRLHLSRRASRRAQLRRFPVNANEAEARRVARFLRMDTRRAASPCASKRAILISRRRSILRRPPVFDERPQADQ